MTQENKPIPRKHKELSELSNNTLIESAIHHPIDNFHTLDSENKNGVSVEETYRTEFRRQRDRILYTGAFRRLQDKTQVLDAQKSGDHRTRLTHTLEVEQIAISIADALGLNKDLTSAIALGHDVGHTPFGHAGERALDSHLENCGGFNHAIQSVRYFQYRNIKLSQYILEGILLHDSDVVKKNIDSNNSQLSFTNKLLNNNYYPCYEAQIVFWADKLAYLTHDLEDFKVHVYDRNKNQFKETCDLENLNKSLSKIIDKNTNIENYTTRDLIRNILDNLIKHSSEFLNNEPLYVNKNKINKEVKDVKEEYLDKMQINLNDDFRKNYKELRKKLTNLFIQSSLVQQNDTKAKNIIDTIFNIISKNIKLLPMRYSDTLEKEYVKSSILKHLSHKVGKINTYKLIEYLKETSNEPKTDSDTLLKNTAEYIRYYNKSFLLGSSLSEKDIKNYIQENKEDITLRAYYELLNDQETLKEHILNNQTLEKCFKDFHKGKLDFTELCEKVKNYQTYQYFIDEIDIQELCEKRKNIKDLLNSNETKGKSFIEQYKQQLKKQEEELNVNSDFGKKIPILEEDELILINYINNYFNKKHLEEKQAEEFFIGDIFGKKESESIKEHILFIERIRLYKQNKIKNRIIADYIASMTDKYATKIYNDLMGFNF